MGLKKGAEGGRNPQGVKLKPANINSSSGGANYSQQLFSHNTSKEDYTVTSNSAGVSGATGAGKVTHNNKAKNNGFQHY